MTRFEYEGKEYELLLTRAGVRAAEAQGMKLSDIGEQPFTGASHLFFAALYSKHKVNPAKAATMLDTLLDSGELTLGGLLEELTEAYNELFGSSESDSVD